MHSLFKRIQNKGFRCLMPILAFIIIFSESTFAQRTGALDRSFNYGRGQNYEFNYGFSSTSTLAAVAVQADGKILVNGDYYGGYPNLSNRGRSIYRLNSDGGVDFSFVPGPEVNTFIEAIAIQPDGKIVAAGNSRQLNGATGPSINRFNTDGSLDTAFQNSNPIVSGIVLTLLIQPDGKILIGGQFFTVNNVARSCIARLNPDGTLDNSFNPGTGVVRSVTAYPTVHTMALTADGKILIGGDFRRYNGTSRNYLAMINPDGSLFEGFNPGTGPNNVVKDLAIQPDGKIVIGGEFTAYGSQTENRITRIDAFGSLDFTFQNGTGAEINGTPYREAVNKIIIQPDGKILFAGDVITYNGFNIGRLSRLNGNGTLDTEFNNNIRFGDVSKINLLPNGKILIRADKRLNSDGTLDLNLDRYPLVYGEYFTAALHPNNKLLIGSGAVRRINGENGSLDTSFRIAGFSKSFTVATQSDGKILIGGGLNRETSSSVSGNIKRVNPNGTLDSTFNVGIGTNGFVSAIVIQPNGKILVAGNFTNYNGNSRNHIVRLNTDGTIDQSFNIGLGTDGDIFTLVLQPDGKIIITGSFTDYNYTSRSGIARLNSNGSIDNSFNVGSGANNMINTSTLQLDGKLIIAGDFTSFNGRLINRIARLNMNGSLDTTFNPGVGVALNLNSNPSIKIVTPQSDGKILIAGDFIFYNGKSRNRLARLNIDGSLDTTFTPVGANNTITAMVIQNDGRVVVAGDFTMYDYLLTNRTARFNTEPCTIPPSPIIVPQGSTNLCLGDSIILTATGAPSYLWNTGERTASIKVGALGMYSVRGIDGACAPSVASQIEITRSTSQVIAPTPQLIIDSLQNYCLGSELTLRVIGNYNQYRWNNGETTPTIVVNKTGRYFAKVSDGTNCWSLPSRTAFILFDTTFCDHAISILGTNSLRASISAERYEWFLDGELIPNYNSRVIPIQGNGSYTVRAVIGERVSPLSEPLVVTSSRKSLAKTQFEVFPNPATDKVTIKATGTGTLEILNTLGQVVITQPATETNEINVSKISKGFYTVRFNSESKILIVK